MLDLAVKASEPAEMPDCDPAPTPQSVLMVVLSVFERSGVPFVVTHGYERFPELSGSDVDICLDESASDRWVRALLDENAEEIGARVIDQHGGAFLLCGTTAGRRLFFLKLDIERGYTLHGMTFVDGRELLASRRSAGSFHVPAPAHELAGSLATAIVKDKLNAGRTRRLTVLYRVDPVGSERAIARLWPAHEAGILIEALRNDVWTNVVAAAPLLRARLIRRNPIGRLAWKAAGWADRLGRLIRPPGLSVAVLGPDGAGKSTVTDALGDSELMPIFERSVCWGFVPPLHRLIGRNHGPSSEPHALAPRRLASSLIKAAYWLVFSCLSHPRTYLMKARRGLVLYDRHFVDILVDPRRYRYSGPRWVLDLIWRLIPRPDLVVLLDGPAAKIQQRKRELTVAETERQLEAYRTLVRSLPGGAIVDADRSLDEVIDAVKQRILIARVRISR